MEKINLSAKTRNVTGKKVKILRNQGFLPISLYGQGKKAENLVISDREFEKVFKIAGVNTLVDLKIDDKNPINILIKDVQYHPVTDKNLHADFYKIKMDEEITTTIPLNFVGIAPAVKELEGNLITNKDEVEVKCLPADLIHKIEVDISVLQTFDDAIHIRDLKVPVTIKIQDDPEDVVVLVTPPRSEEELQAMEAEAAADSEKAQIEKMETEAEAEKAEKVKDDKQEEKGEEAGEKQEEEKK